MAYVENIWLIDGRRNNSMTVYIKLRPAGKVTIEVPLPKTLFEVILSAAQTAADAHEAQMRAEILGEQYAPEITQENYKGE